MGDGEVAGTGARGQGMTDGRAGLSGVAEGNGPERIGAEVGDVEEGGAAGESDGVGVGCGLAGFAGPFSGKLKAGGRRGGADAAVRGDGEEGDAADVVPAAGAAEVGGGQKGEGGIDGEVAGGDAEGGLAVGGLEGGERGRAAEALDGAGVAVGVGRAVAAGEDAGAIRGSAEESGGTFDGGEPGALDAIDFRMELKFPKAIRCGGEEVAGEGFVHGVGGPEGISRRVRSSRCRRRPRRG